MILISHRGNIDSVIKNKENTLPYIDNAISLGYDVEIDLRRIDQNLYLGHDKPEQKVDYDWLFERRKNLWIHVKDINSFNFCLDTPLTYFFHEKERHTLISNNLIWSHDLSEATEKSIIPLINLKIDKNEAKKYKKVAGICSDYISHYREIML